MKSAVNPVIENVEKDLTLFKSAIQKGQTTPQTNIIRSKNLIRSVCAYLTDQEILTNKKV